MSDDETTLSVPVTVTVETVEEGAVLGHVLGVATQFFHTGTAAAIKSGALTPDQADEAARNVAILDRLGVRLNEAFAAAHTTAAERGLPFPH